MRLSRQKRDSDMKSGIASSLATTIQRNSALAGGTVTLLVAMTLISLNAVWFQSSKHPAPIFSTRVISQPAILSQTDKKAGTGIFTQQLPDTSPGTSAIETKADDLTRDIQAALADKHLYAGEPDGVYGSKTRAAIIAYQKGAHMEVTGAVSTKLLTRILMSGKAPAHALPQKIQTTLRGKEKERKSDRLSELVSAIQTGLRNYGYDNVVIDGVMGSQTAEAIRRFELDYGLRITGKASQILLEKLTDIGAVDRG